MNKLIYVILLAGLAFALYVFGAFDFMVGVKQEVEAQRQFQSRMSELTRRQQLTDEEWEKEREPGFGGRWAYRETEDDMGRGATRSALVRSLKSADRRASIYEEERHAWLILRESWQDDGARVAFVRLERERSNCPVFGACEITVRFGDQEPKSFVGRESTGRDALFISDYGAFVQGLREAELVRIEIPVFGAGRKIYDFRVANLSSEW